MIEQDGEFFKEINGKILPCYESGMLKDFQDEEIVVHYGKVFNKVKPHERQQMIFNISKKMLERFGWHSSMATLRSLSGERLTPDGVLTPKRKRRVK